MPTTADLRPTPAQLRGAARELARRPRAIPADLDGLGRLPGPVERAVLRVYDLYPRVATAVPRLVLAAAATTPPPGRCRWCRARQAARVHRTRLRLTDPTSRTLLGPACGWCRAALAPPKPRVAPTRAAPPGRRLPATPAEVTARLSGTGRPTTAAATQHMSVETARYNLEALERMGLDPSRYPGLVLAR